MFLYLQGVTDTVVLYLLITRNHAFILTAYLLIRLYQIKKSLRDKAVKDDDGDTNEFGNHNFPEVVRIICNGDEEMVRVATEAIRDCDDGYSALLYRDDLEAFRDNYSCYIDWKEGADELLRGLQEVADKIGLEVDMNTCTVARKFAENPNLSVCQALYDVSVFMAEKHYVLANLSLEDSYILILIRENQFEALEQLIEQDGETLFRCLDQQEP
jgi:hypothetical protein